MNSLSKVKIFDIIQQNDKGKQIETKLATPV